MTDIERNLLENIKKNLLNSINKDWGVGDVDDWYDYAHKMKHAIENSVPILETLISKEKNTEES